MQDSGPAGPRTSNVAHGKARGHWGVRLSMLASVPGGAGNAREGCCSARPRITSIAW